MYICVWFVTIFEHFVLWRFMDNSQKIVLTGNYKKRKHRYAFLQFTSLNDMLYLFFYCRHPQLITLVRKSKRRFCFYPFIDTCRRDVHHWIINHINIRNSGENMYQLIDIHPAWQLLRFITNIEGKHIVRHSWAKNRTNWINNRTT